MTLLITDSSALETFCAPLREAEFITVDTEFIRERTYFPQLCLIQIAGPEEGHAAAIDPLAEGIDLAPVFDLMRDERILKVFHAGKQDLEILLMLMDAIPKPLFDTQIAAMVLGYGEQVGYEALVNKLIGASLDKSQQFTDWAQRPLSDRQLVYALSDVVYLRDIYRKLNTQILEQGRGLWLDEETVQLYERGLYITEPAEAWKKQKKRQGSPHYLARLKTLAAWREVEARRRNLPRGHILKDDTLQELALLSPKSTEAFKKLRSKDRTLSPEDQQRLIALIAEANALPKEQCPALPWKPPVAQELEYVRDLLKLLLKVIADQHKVSPRMLADSDELTAFAEGQQDLAMLKGWRYDLFGKFAEAMLRGELQLIYDADKRAVIYR